MEAAPLLVALDRLLEVLSGTNTFIWLSRAWADVAVGLAESWNVLGELVYIVNGVRPPGP